MDEEAVDEELVSGSARTGSGHAGLHPGSLWAWFGGREAAAGGSSWPLPVRALPDTIFSST